MPIPGYDHPNCFVAGRLQIPVQGHVNTRRAYGKFTGPGMRVDCRTELKTSVAKILQQLTADQERISRERAKLERREGELGSYLGILQAELERMARAKASGEVFADLKVTHCPVCDQEVGPVPSHSGTCFLCSKPLPPADTPAAVRRIAFEEDQLIEEVSELEPLLSGIRGEMVEMDNGLVKLAEANRVSTTVQHTSSTLSPVSLCHLKVIHIETPQSHSLCDDACCVAGHQRINTLDQIHATVDFVEYPCPRR